MRLAGPFKFFLDFFLSAFSSLVTLFQDGLQMLRPEVQKWVFVREAPKKESQLFPVS